jgi:hypothetical protein
MKPRDGHKYIMKTSLWLGFRQFAVLLLVATIVSTGAVIVRLDRKDGNTVSFDSNVDHLFAAIKNDVNANLANDYKVDVEPWYAQDTRGTRGMYVSGYTFQLSTAALHTVRIQPRLPRDSEGGSNFTPSVATDTVHDRVATIMRQNGFAVGGRIGNGLGTGSKTLYTRGSEICTLTENRVTYDLALVCDSPALRNQLAAQATLFIPQYLSKHPDVQASDITFGPVIIKSRHAAGVLHPSKTAGYDIAEALITEPRGTRLVLYYQKQNGPWVYITDTTDEFGFTCSDIRADPDARKAMYAEVCYERPDQGPRLLDAAGRATQ